ncbi:MAG: homogentisate 1,2-dioxygenase [Bacteroidetes bacterium]|nr:homogentisate 1,2-dioxygenase [Bacteroidota bacterium]
MPIYQRQGKIPHKRHIVFRSEKGDLYHEELFGTEGFANTSSLLYHLNPPTMVKEIGDPYSVRPEVGVEDNLRAVSFKGYNVEPEEDYIKSRKIFFFNDDLNIGIACPSKSMNEYFYKNADSDEMLFIHKGSGRFKSMHGTIDFEYGDYIVIPRGIVYRLEFDGAENKILFIEAHSAIRTPRKYRNEFGQHLEHSPFCERDFKLPHSLETHDEKGDFKIMIKRRGMIHAYTYATHPFDLVGWDGYVYPYGFSIFNFEPITGRLHMPPPIHQQFEGRNFVTCSFVPRLYDYHPDAIPVSYHHSNVDSEEILYYVEGDFMSRNNISAGQFTLHPAGVPHGPHPGAIERSLGKKDTAEYAVMIDPFNPIKISKEALKYEVKDYYKSWMIK